MEINYSKKDKLLKVEITEEIDHHIVEKIRRKVDDEITRHMPRKTVFDFDRVSFMDSAGIGMIIGRYKMMKLIGGSLEIINISQTVRRILEMSGINKIIPMAGWWDLTKGTLLKCKIKVTEVDTFKVKKVDKKEVATSEKIEAFINGGGKENVW